jgi:outer membrane receptor protein involved in Fe transport
MNRKTQAVFPLFLFAAIFSRGALAQEEQASSFVEDDTVVTLPTLVVSGERDSLLDALSPGVVSVVRPDDVKGEHKSIPDLLDQIPGVYVRSQSGSAHYTTASIRGSAPSQVNIYIDGIPMNLSSEMAADISTLPISGIERVEVYRGTTPARFSGAPVGGAINIVTKKPESFVGSISAGKRSFHGEQYAANMHFPLLGGHMLIGLDRDSSDGDFEYRDKEVEFRDGIGANIQNLPVKRTRQANRVDKENALFKWESKRFIAKFAATDLDRMLPERIVSDGYNRQDLPQYTPTYWNQEQRQVMRKREALVGWRDSFGPLDAALNLTWLKNHQSYRNGFVMKILSACSECYMGGAWNDYDTTRRGISGDLVYRFNEGGSIQHQAELHADYYKEELEAELSAYDAQSDFLSQFSRKKRDLQVQDMITIAPLGNLQVTPIVRYERLDGPTIGSQWGRGWPPGKGDLKSKTTGGVSVKKNFENGWQVFTNTGTYIRFPNFYEIYGNGFGMARGVDSAGRTNPLMPETGRNSDVGVGWQGRLSEKFRGNFRLTYFRRKTDTSITLFSTPIGAQYVNGGPAIFKGIELEGNLAWSRRADLQFAFTRQDAYYTGDYSYWGYPATFVRPEERYPGQKVLVRNVPDVVANARLNLRFFNNALTTFVEANHIGRVYIGQELWEEPLTTVNLGGSWLAAKTGPNKGLRLSFGVNDIFDKGPEQELGGDLRNSSLGNIHTPRNVQYPYQGRTLYTTLNWSY